MVINNSLIPQYEIYCGFNNSHLLSQIFYLNYFPKLKTNNIAILKNKLKGTFGFFLFCIILLYYIFLN